MRLLDSLAPMFLNQILPELLERAGKSMRPRPVTRAFLAMPVFTLGFAAGLASGYLAWRKFQDASRQAETSGASYPASTPSTSGTNSGPDVRATQASI